MGKIIVYQLIWLIVIFIIIISELIAPLKILTQNIYEFINCSLIASTGGVLYCLRGIYVNKAAKKNWDEDWIVWYYLRPLTSLISGAISYIFVEAGLFILQATTRESTIPYGFYAVAFIAGYNVDKFLKKLENIADSVWGIEKSRSSNN